MPMESDFAALLAPLTLAGRRLRNRVVHASMTTMMASGGRVSDALITYHANRARGGAAMTITEPIGMAHHQARLARTQAWNDADMDGFKRWADAVESQDCRLIGQIQDAGRGRHYPGRNPEAIGASALPDDLSWTVPHALTVDEIRALISEIAGSSHRLMRCGFSGVELSCGHGHLFHQFLSPASNRRTDDYGGDRNRRVRIVAELVAAIRALCGPGFIIGLKLPGEDGVPGGIDPVEAAPIAHMLTAPRDADYVCFAQGAHARTLEMHVPDRYGPRLVYMDIIRALRQAVNGLPLMALGRITDPAEAEGILARGEAELIGLGRALVADPAWLDKARHGRSHDIRYCLSCNTCWGTIVAAHLPIACVNNPRVGRVDEVDYRPASAPVRRRVVVVGAGIAGMEAAWVAASRGHDVTVFGRSTEVGGQARLRALLPGGETITSIYDYQLVAAQRAGARLELGVVATAEDLRALRPDAVILAAGATMIRPDWLAEDFDLLVPDLRAAVPKLAYLTGRQDATAVVFDMDHTEATYAAAEFLRARFARVVLITPRDTIAVDVQMVTRQGILRRMAEQQIEIVTLSMPVWSATIEDGVLEYTNIYTGKVSRVSDVAFVAYATPRAPNDAMAEGLRLHGVPVHLVGDCLAPLELLAATATGHAAGEIV
jgi:hypothetical protein